MSFTLLQKVKIIIDSSEYEEFYGMQGAIVNLEQMPSDILPNIKVYLDNGIILEGLYPSDIEVVG